MLTQRDFSVLAARGRATSVKVVSVVARVRRQSAALGAHVAARRVRLATWLTIIGFALAAFSAMLYQSRGPFIDEGIYISAGIRTLQGYATNDNYLSWISGSLLWPVAAALAYRVGGLIGARVLALLCVTTAIAASVDAARLMYGRRVALGSAIALSVCGPTLALAQLAVYDQFALAGIGMAFWAIARLAASDDRRWIVVAGLAFSVGVISKYPMALCGLPLGLLLLGLRGRRARLDLILFGFVMCVPWLIFLMPYRSELATFLAGRLAHNPGFGYSERMIVASMLMFAGPPVALTIVGAALSGGRWLAAAAQVVGVILWPAYHILTANYVSSTKHIVFGFVLAGPLMGVTLMRLWNWSSGRALRLATQLGTAALVVMLAVLSVGQFTFLSQPISTDPEKYLVQQVQPGEQLLISDGWPYRLDLYTAGRITSPWDVVDADSLTYPGHSQDVCEYDWYVNEQYGYAWPAAVQRQVAACGVYVEVYSSTSYATGLGQNLRL
ncbi:MAG TPA: glycosyltransferase family 39 protein, partial [Ktedonobacterales bacterium]|nr:glycosyltransferase family 39 protein [Ktedonobacterales bacterium]